MSNQEEFENRLAMIAHQAGPKTEVASLRLSVEQKKAIQENADIFTEGNISEWMMVAAIDYVPWGE